jgi:nitrogen fixation NifU-like protein
MSDLRDLYQETILDHYKRPRNFGALAGADRRAEGNNPLCGDRIDDIVRLDGERVDEVAFTGSGCAISTASASLMTEAVKGRSLEEAERLFHQFHEMLTGDPSREARAAEELGKLAVFAGVREYPVRVKCATLAWHTLRAACAGRREPVTTES